jgi:hypothetical protein
MRGPAGPDRAVGGVVASTILSTPVVSSRPAAVEDGAETARDGWRRRLSGRQLQDLLAIGLLLLLSLTLVIVLRDMLTRPLWYNEQWRAWHFSLYGQFLEQLPKTNSPMAAGWVVLTKASALALGNSEVALRLPIALTTPTLAWVGYLLARRWLGVGASLLTMVALLANVMIMTYSAQLAPYDLEAVSTATVLLLWLQATDPGRSARGRWIRYMAIGTLALLATPVTFLLGPLLVIDLLRSWRDRRWQELGPTVAAGGLALGHLVLYIGRQTWQSRSPYWNDFFLPHGSLGQAVNFLGRQLASWVPGALTGQMSYLPSVPEGTLALGLVPAVLLSGFLLVALASGVGFAVADPRLRVLLVAVGGCFALQALASALQLWPFGFTRVNTFVLPLGYVLGAVGIHRLLMGLRRLGARGAWRPLALATTVLAVTLASAGFLEVLVVGARQLAAVRADARGPAFASGMPELVAATRTNAGGGDVAVVVHLMAAKGWGYYMRFHRSDNPRLAEAPRIGPDRTLVLSSRPNQEERRRLRGFLAEHPEAKRVFVMILWGTRPETAQEIRRIVRDAGYRVTAVWRTPHTGRVVKMIRPSPR